ncbi:hypothetical protein GCM10010406_48000 [Streptomyces thermolineatus]|uniref:Uncharacterized protein n=1 Tax=Streptomyces thermolineatus TaxID=44033 RepID=A0ABN3MP79_9ACTN
MAPHFEDDRMPPTGRKTSGDWVHGRCWLYCRRTGVPVIWIGPVQSAGMQAPMYGCAVCIAELNRLVWTSLTAKDRSRFPSR